MKRSVAQPRKTPSNGTVRDAEIKVTPTQIKELNPWEDLQTYARRYFREQPEISALACLGIGFVLGWKLKPW